MKFKRFMFKVLRLKVLIPILIVIIAGVLLIGYFFGGVKATAINTSEMNLEFDFSKFKSYENEEFDKDLIFSEERPYCKWLAQNEKYVMYFDYATTIAYVYQINDESITGTKEIHDGKSYDKIDITKCTVCYSTAKDTTSDAKGANFAVTYANSSDGRTAASDLNTMTNSVFYFNSLTEEIEHHYFINDDVEDGIQVYYAVGEFSAGSAYFPEYFYQTMYKPYNEKVLDEDDEIIEKSYYADTEAFEKAKTYWIQYMEKLGVSDPWNADYDVIQGALAQTYEQKFRGNALFKMQTGKKTDSKAGTSTWGYTGTVTVYTVEGYEYMVELAKQGKITYEDVTFKYDDTASASKYFKYGNATWKFTKVSDNFFAGEGEFFNCEDSPIIVNTAIPSKFFEGDLGYNNTGNAYNITSDNKNPFRYYYRKSLSPFIKTSIFAMLYTNTNVWVDSVYKYKFVDEDGNQVNCGGILKVENGKYVYGGDGKIEKTVYTLNMAAEDNALFDIETTTNLAVFGFAVEFKLTDKGLSTTILSESLVDSSNAKSKDITLDIGGIETKLSSINTKYQMLNITVLPQLTTIENSVDHPDTNEDGYILVPDGSGAVINFNNGKYELGYEGINKVYYGSDNTFATKKQPEDTKDLMLGMFGFVCTTENVERGIIGIIEQGGSQNTLLANTDQYKNYAYFKLCVRRNQEVKIGTGSGARPFYKLAKTMADIDAKYMYMFLEDDEIDYSSIAKKYQSYLIERDFGENPNATEVYRDTTKNTVVDLNFLGSFEKYALFLGFKYKTADSLTTFNQAEEIISELKSGVDVNGESKKINDYSVSYTSWTSEELEYELGGSISVNNVLGGINSMKKFANYLNDDGKSLYLETKITTTKDYDFWFGQLKFNARNVANEVAAVYDYDPSTLRQNKKLSLTNYINPIYFVSITNYVMDKMSGIDKKVSNVGYYLNDLGNNTTNSYKQNEEIYGSKSVAYQQESLAILAKNGKVKVEAPYDYSFKYVSEATNIPLTSTLAPIYDETIPFYQLVISGLFDYTTEDINGTSNNSAEWFYAKAIETGSNLSFVISAENPNILLDTDYTYFYQSYYENWKENIVTFASKIDELGIHQGRLEYHQAIGKNVAFVQYKGDITLNLCVNTTENAYVVESPLVINGVVIPANTVIPAYGYYKIG